MKSVFNKKTVGGFFLAVLILLIFCSKTIYAYNLPVVTAVAPKNGKLSKLEIGTGIADWANTEKLYAAVNGTIEEVLVKEGDYVAEGQELLRLRFDRDEAQRRLREIANSRSKLSTDIQGVNLKLEQINRHMADLESESYREDDISSYERDLLAIEIRKARAEYEDVRDRYDDGDATDVEVDNARYNLQSLYIKQENAEKTMADQEEKAKEALQDKEKSRETKLKDYEADKAALQLDLQAKNIDMNSLSLQEEPYKKALSDFDTYAVITAPEAGTLLSLSGTKGEAIKEDQLVAAIGAGSEFEVDCTLSLDNNFVVAGDTCDLSNATNVVKGTVAKVTPTAQGKTVHVSFSSDVVTAGETFDITFTKESATSYTLVPNGALNQDNDGYFVNQIKRRDGILGQEYYLQRLDVYIGDSDTKHTAIVRGISFFEPVALFSDKPVSAGDTITLQNAGDFFES